MGEEVQERRGGPGAERGGSGEERVDSGEEWNSRGGDEAPGLERMLCFSLEGKWPTGWGVLSSMVVGSVIGVRLPMRGRRCVRESNLWRLC